MKKEGGWEGGEFSTCCMASDGGREGGCEKEEFDVLNLSGVDASTHDKVQLVRLYRPFTNSGF